MRYTCQTKSRTHGDCDGQTGYTVQKLDGIVEATIRQIFDQVMRVSRDDILDVTYRSDHRARQALAQRAKREYDKAESDLQQLKAEVIKAIVGESAFTPELLNSAIRDQEALCEDLRQAYSKAVKAVTDGAALHPAIDQQYNELVECARAYDNATIAAKKMIISQLVERVDVYRDYKLTLTFRINMRQLIKALERLDENMVSA